MPKNSFSKNTSLNIQEIQDEIFRKMKPEKRLRIAGEMFDFAKK